LKKKNMGEFNAYEAIENEGGGDHLKKKGDWGELYMKPTCGLKKREKTKKK